MMQKKPYMTNILKLPSPITRVQRFNDNVAIITDKSFILFSPFQLDRELGGICHVNYQHTKNIIAMCPVCVRNSYIASLFYGDGSYIFKSRKKRIKKKINTEPPSSPKICLPEPKPPDEPKPFLSIKKVKNFVKKKIFTNPNQSYNLNPSSSISKLLIDEDYSSNSNSIRLKSVNTDPNLLQNKRSSIARFSSQKVSLFQNNTEQTEANSSFFIHEQNTLNSINDNQNSNFNEEEEFIDSSLTDINNLPITIVIKTTIIIYILLFLSSEFFQMIDFLLLLNVIIVYFISSEDGNFENQIEFTQSGEFNTNFGFENENERQWGEDDDSNGWRLEQPKRSTGGWGDEEENDDGSGWRKDENENENENGWSSEQPKRSTGGWGDEDENDDGSGWRKDENEENGNGWTDQPKRSTGGWGDEEENDDGSGWRKDENENENGWSSEQPKRSNGGWGDEDENSNGWNSEPKTITDGWENTENSGTTWGNDERSTRKKGNRKAWGDDDSNTNNNDEEEEEENEEEERSELENEEALNKSNSETIWLYVDSDNCFSAFSINLRCKLISFKFPRVNNIIDICGIDNPNCKNGQFAILTTSDVLICEMPLQNETENSNKNENDNDNDNDEEPDEMDKYLVFVYQTEVTNISPFLNGFLMMRDQIIEFYHDCQISTFYKKNPLTTFFVTSPIDKRNRKRYENLISNHINYQVKNNKIILLEKLNKDIILYEMNGEKKLGIKKCNLLGVYDEWVVSLCSDKFLIISNINEKEESIKIPVDLPSEKIKDMKQIIVGYNNLKNSLVILLIFTDEIAFCYADLSILTGFYEEEEEEEEEEEDT